MDANTRRAIRALGVIVKTPHIQAYLVSHDPKAYRQAVEAFTSFSTEELTDAYVIEYQEACREPRA